MKVVYIHQHFCTNEGTGGTRSYDVSRHLVRWGHDVTVICGKSERAGFGSLPGGRLFHVRHFDGIKVIVCNVAYANVHRVPRRMWAFFSFALLALIAAIRERNVDLVFATSTPLTVGLPGRLAATFKRVPFVFEVRDLWPEDLLAAGRLKQGPVYWFWQWLEAFAYRTAKRIVLVSRGFHDRLLERGLTPQRLRTILLGADGSLFRDVRPNVDYMRCHGLADKTVAIFTGAHGDANGLFQLLDAAERLRDRPDIAITMIGHGKKKAELIEEVANRGLGNVYFLDPVPKHELPQILAASHIGLMILKQIIRPRWVTPNKLFDYMFSGLPTIVNFAGTTAELVEREGVGVAATPGCPDDLAARIRYYADHPDERRSVGLHAREVAGARYDRERIAGQLLELFSECLRSNRRGRQANHVDDGRRELSTSVPARMPSE